MLLLENREEHESVPPGLIRQWCRQAWCRV